MQQQKSHQRKTSRTHRRQFKTWISDSDHKWLGVEAEASDQSMSGVMRGLIKLGRAQRTASSRN